ncbi:hypothetical protein ACA910_011742 [Epithemia clementina (nom. ined.)]
MRHGVNACIRSNSGCRCHTMLAYRIGVFCCVWLSKVRIEFGVHIPDTPMSRHCLVSTTILYINDEQHDQQQNNKARSWWKMTTRVTVTTRMKTLDTGVFGIVKIRLLGEEREAYHQVPFFFFFFLWYQQAATQPKMSCWKYIKLELPFFFYSSNPTQDGLLEIYKVGTAIFFTTLEWFGRGVHIVFFLVVA